MSSRILTVCLLTSLAAHAVVLLPWIWNSHHLALTSTEMAPLRLNVLLEDGKKSVPPVTKQTAEKYPPQPRQTLTPAVTHTNIDITAHEAAQSSQVATNATVTAPLHDSIIRSKVLSYVQTDFSRYFNYPMLARRKGWQGNVLIGFWVEANGMISNAKITQGSGYPLLDESALSALQQLQHVPNASEWLKGTRIELSLPVLYRLQGS